jgi:hypothetical protein
LCKFSTENKFSEKLGFAIDTLARALFLTLQMHNWLWRKIKGVFGILVLSALQ